MQKVGTVFNQTFCNTTSLGTYQVNGLGDPSGVNEIFVYDFIVTVSGTILSTSQGILYMIFLLLSLIFFFLSMYGAIIIPFRNYRSEHGYIIGVNDLKHIKVFLIAISYLLLMSVFGFARGISANFIPEIAFYKLFNWLFFFMLSLLYPIMVVSLLFIVIMFFQDKRLKNDLERGAIFR